MAMDSLPLWATPEEDVIPRPQVQGEHQCGGRLPAATSQATRASVRLAQGAGTVAPVVLKRPPMLLHYVSFS